MKNHISEKGIKINAKGKKLFDQFDYFQVINGYKYLFIDSVERIDEIKRKIYSPTNSYAGFYANFFNIRTFSSNDDLFTKVCKNICKKYGITLGNNCLTQAMEAEIKNIKYVRHIFAPNCNYEDFVRVYLFEHELRSILLKYILFVEERIKKIFIAKLNDMNIDANCLADISNYNLSRNNKNDALGSLGMIINMHNNKHSKPILHKMEQELIVPYWIIINQMTLKQTLITAKSLKEEYSKMIFESLTNKLTGCNYDTFDKTKDRVEKKKENKTINKFSDILFHLADFRNHLAHNQPIYCYNVRQHFPFQIDMPFLKTNSDIYKRNLENGMQYIDQQRQLNSSLLTATISLFGEDAFNNRVGSNGFDINLSWIIYVVNRIINVISPINTMKSEICELYMKFNIILSYTSTFYRENTANELINFLSSGKIEGNRISFNKGKLERRIKKITDNPKKSKYSPFERISQYYNYTKIDENFLINVLR